MTTVTFLFRDYLRTHLDSGYQAVQSFQHEFDRRASVKDVIEALGVPHPIVGELRVNSRETGFDYILQPGDMVEVKPLTPPVNPMVSTILRPEPLDRISFAVDVNVGRLAQFLRMLGFDTVYGTGIRDAGLAETAASQKRILLSRDTSLLKRKIVTHAYLPRSEDPADQLVEVLRLYGLSSRIKPLSRCIPCNNLLIPVAKEVVLDRLEPLTKKYYDKFYLCKNCNRIYWPGSHQEKMNIFIEQILLRLNQP